MHLFTLFTKTPGSASLLCEVAADRMVLSYRLSTKLMLLSIGSFDSHNMVIEHSAEITGRGIVLPVFLFSAFPHHDQ